MSIHFSRPPEDSCVVVEDLQAEFMEKMQVGERDAFDFALENSDEANYALQALAMDMMGVGGEGLKKLKTPNARAAALALWTLCARQAFLDVVEMKVAPLWAEKELPKRIAEFEEMRAERENPMQVML